MTTESIPRPVKRLTLESIDNGAVLEQFNDELQKLHKALKVAGAEGKGKVILVTEIESYAGRFGRTVKCSIKSVSPVLAKSIYEMRGEGDEDGNLNQADADMPEPVVPKKGRKAKKAEPIAELPAPQPEGTQALTWPLGETAATEPPNWPHVETSHVEQAAS